MRLMRALAALLILLGVAFAPPARAAEAVTLRVALYPYVPGAHALFAQLAREFERRHEGAKLALVEVDPQKDYYDDGLLTLDADVFEIDTILLSDMIAAGRIAPLDVSLAGFAPEAIEAVTRDNTVYAVPHWLCGNFLFYAASDTAIRDAVTWADLLQVLAREKRTLLVDLFGSLTLGEWYLTLLSDRVGVAAAQEAVLAGGEPDETVVADLRAILPACPAGSCRSRDAHERPGHYAAAFVCRELRAAYIGYSETLHFALEAINNSPPNLWCVDPSAIAVRRLPTLNRGAASEGIGWVDGLAIAAGLTGAKKDLALKFIAFATSADGYRAALQTQGTEAPRYLLPARTGLTFENAPLYPDLAAAHAGRKTGTMPGLNARLRALGAKLNCLLPIDPADTRTIASCRP
jgi:thiamine pyridinylase